MDYVLYVVDTETTGLDDRLNDVIELSLYRLTDGVQKTWCLKPINPSNIDAVALRINGHKIENLLHQTKEGRETYQEADKVIVEIENWIMQDDVPTTQRILVGQNVNFDKGMLEQLWIKCGAKDTFPFGRRTMDTMMLAFMMDYVEGTMSDSYSLSSLIKKYGIKNEKSHTAASDVRATKELFERQVADLRKKMSMKEKS